MGLPGISDWSKPSIRTNCSRSALPKKSFGFCIFLSYSSVICFLAALTSVLYYYLTRFLFPSLDILKGVVSFYSIARGLASSSWAAGYPEEYSFDLLSSLPLNLLMIGRPSLILFKASYLIFNRSAVSLSFYILIRRSLTWKGYDSNVYICGGSSFYIFSWGFASKLFLLSKSNGGRFLLPIGCCGPYPNFDTASFFGEAFGDFIWISGTTGGPGYSLILVFFAYMWGF